MCVEQFHWLTAAPDAGYDNRSRIGTDPAQLHPASQRAPTTAPRPRDFPQATLLTGLIDMHVQLCEDSGLGALKRLPSTSPRTS
jgi:hypothetical protein